MCVCVRACVLACVRACMLACLHACVCVRNYILPGFNILLHKCCLFICCGRLSVSLLVFLVFCCLKNFVLL